MNKDNSNKKDQNKNENTNKQQQNEVSPYSRGKDLNPTQNPDRNPDDFTKHMKHQDRADNVKGRTQETHPTNSPGHVND